MSSHVDEWNGDLVIEAPNGDRARLHFSRFHGLVITASRRYLDGEEREVSAYLDDPAPILAWLKQVTA